MPMCWGSIWAESWGTERIILIDGFGEDIPDREDSQAKAENGTLREDIQKTVSRDEWEIELEWEVGRNCGGPYTSN